MCHDEGLESETVAYLLIIFSLENVNICVIMTICFIWMLFSKHAHIVSRRSNKSGPPDITGVYNMKLTSQHVHNMMLDASVLRH